MVTVRTDRAPVIELHSELALSFLGLEQRSTSYCQKGGNSSSSKETALSNTKV
jgi:hypothetical protein